MSNYKIYYNGLNYWVGLVVKDRGGQAVHVATVSDYTKNKKLAKQWLKKLELYVANN